MEAVCWCLLVVGTGGALGARAAGARVRWRLAGGLGHYIVSITKSVTNQDTKLPQNKQNKISTHRTWAGRGLWTDGASRFHRIRTQKRLLMTFENS